MTTHLIIPDPHAMPGVPNDRFDAAGRYILDNKPDVVICLGDLSDLPSLCTHDRYAKNSAVRRFKADAEVTVDAQERLWGPVNAYNEQRRRLKEKQYKPRKVLCLGNHEDRIDRTLDEWPEFEEVISLDALRYHDFWDEVVPYKSPIYIDGIAYCHFFPSGNMGRPISGRNLARTLINVNHMSSTVGHDHRFQLANDTRPDGSRVWGLSAGCFFDHDAQWAGNSQREWWRGLIEKKNVCNGDYSINLIDMADLLRQYS